MTTTFTETFTGADSSAPSSAWTLTNATGASQSIQGNRLRQIAGSTAATAAAARFNLSSSITDFELWASCEFMTSLDSYFLIPFRGSAFAPNRGIPSNGYAVYFDGTETLVVFLVTAGSPTGIGSIVVPIGGGNLVNFRLRVVGSNIKVRSWGVGTEPGTWAIDVTDTTYASGFVGIATESTPTGSQEVRWDNFTLELLTAVPFKAQDVGNQVSNSAATTTVVSFTGPLKPQVGDLVIVDCSRDNDNTDPLTGDSFSDGTANSWTRVVAGANVTTANAGCVGVRFQCLLTVAWSGTQTLTWTHPSRTAAMRVEHWINVSAFRASGTNTATSTAGAPSVALTTPVAGDLVHAMEAIEYSTAGTSTGDADTTNGSWSTFTGPTATSGATLAAVKVIEQWKIVTATGTQTFDPTHSVTTSVDCVAIISAFVPPSAGSTANLGTATVSVAASDLSGTRTPTAATFTTTATTDTGPARTTTAATAALVANNATGPARTTTSAVTALTASNLVAASAAILTTAVAATTALDLDSGRTPAAATVATTANNLTAVAGSTLAAATATVAANTLADALTVPVATTAVLVANNLTATAPSNILLGTATVGVAASPAADTVRTAAAAAAAAVTAAGATGPARTTTAAAVTVAAFDLVAQAPRFIPLGSVTVGLAASNPSSARTTTSATVTTTANPITYTARPVAVAATVLATGINFDAISLGAEPLGSGRTPASAVVSLTASPFGYTDRLTPAQAVVAVTASPLGRVSTTQAAAVGIAAANLVDALTAQAATAAIAAYPLSANALTLGSATAASVAFNLVPNFRTITTALATLTANPLSFTSPALTAATAALTAGALAFAELTTTSATATLAANPLSIGETLAAASIATLAYNLGFAGEYTPTAATVTAQAYNLFLNPTSSLATASASVDAYALNALGTLGSALVALAATPLSTTHQTTAAQASLLASNLIGLRSAALSFGTALANAYGLTTLSLGQSPLGPAFVIVDTFNLHPLLLASAGLASAAFTAQALIPQDAVQGAQAAATTTALALSTQRATTAPLADITAYELTTLSPASTLVGTATVDLTAYNLNNGVPVGPSAVAWHIVTEVVDHAVLTEVVESEGADRVLVEVQ